MQTHIHNGTTGENGDIVATLSSGESAEGDDRPPQIGFAGNITSNELQGPLEDKEISDLVSLMSDGNAYVNVHTDKYPDGAIRGQISSGETDAVAMSTESNNMTSENASAPVMESDSNLTPSGNTTS